MSGFQVEIRYGVHSSCQSCPLPGPHMPNPCPLPCHVTPQPTTPLSFLRAHPSSMLLQCDLGHISNSAHWYSGHCTSVQRCEHFTVSWVKHTFAVCNQFMLKSLFLSLEKQKISIKEEWLPFQIKVGFHVNEFSVCLGWWAVFNF